jgi:GT2 family glycosyltransferase
MPEPPSFSLVFLTYDGEGRIADRLGEVLRFWGPDGQEPRKDIQVIVHDNGSSDGTRFVLADWDKEFAKTQVTFLRLHTATNCGFPEGFNRAVELAVGRLLLLISDDVRLVGPELLTKVQGSLEANPKAILGQRMIDWPAGWNQFADLPQPIAYIDGYFFAMTQPTWRLLGGFDTRYSPHDYEDVDLCHTARSRGIAVLVDPGLPLEHGVDKAAPYGNARYDNTVLQRRRFAEKWRLKAVPERP